MKFSRISRKVVPLFLSTNLYGCTHAGGPHTSAEHDVLVTITIQLWLGRAAHSTSIDQCIFIYFRVTWYCDTRYYVIILLNVTLNSISAPIKLHAENYIVLAPWEHFSMPGVSARWMINGITQLVSRLFNIQLWYQRALMLFSSQ